MLHQADKSVILTLVKAVQYPIPAEPKAFHPMLVTLLGIVTEFKLLQPQKAQLPMFVTLLGMTNSPVKLLQLQKASYPMLVTLLGIVTEVKPVQPEKA